MKSNEVSNDKKELLLLLLPYWTPLIPPLGISCLKAYLESKGHTVTTADGNIQPQMNDIYINYTDKLQEFVPENKKGNFYNLAHRVLRRHMMAYINNDNKKDYYNLIKILVEKVFYFEIDNSQTDELDEIIHNYYNELALYVEKLINKVKPSVLGLSVYKGTLASSLYAARIVRSKFPEIEILMGGGIFADELSFGSPNLDFFLEKTKDYIDHIFVGEGEILFEKYLSGELSANQRVYTLADLNNQIVELSKAPLPDFGELDLRFYPQLASYASRSCPYQCSFCTETVQWGKYRKKSGKQIVNELQSLSKKYNYQLFLMGDSLLNPIVSDVSDEMIDKKLSLYFDGYLRADKPVCDIDNTIKWRKGGFYRARLGVESGSPKVLKLMNKKITIDQIRKSLMNLALSGIKTTTYWVVGHPGETEEDFQQTLDLIEELKDFIWEAECNPFDYFYTGQTNSNTWADKRYRLYPEEAKKMLLVETWALNCEPSREEIYKRVNRFVKHCRRLGIPNPYSLNDINKADERWKKLHKNAVPAVLEFKTGKKINDNLSVEKIHYADKIKEDEGDFVF
ncbi:B12-binding domain-containing radical SAM protein [Abyssisolibacter fermentans]|uniref:B12-binding domain-containing radical SAM protein n=1 Tax=Abyssisolibacter fermentans TaxID=1766203 RepID=UPI00082ECC42|nr:radical SAM protein [Abyssisolibacter fermentans]